MAVDLIKVLLLLCTHVVTGSASVQQSEAETASDFARKGEREEKRICFGLTCHL